MVQEKHISKRRSKLSAAKRALLEKRLRGELADDSKSHVIRPRQEPDLFPLSFAQERLWFLDQLEPGNPAYNRPMALRLTGSLNVKALQQALSEILKRHEVLRATFPSVEGRPTQIITQPQSQNLPVLDLSEQSPNEREARALWLVTEEAQKPFDLSKGPLLRATLLRLDKEEHILLLVIQHIVFDAWSARVFTEEILELYEAFSKGRPSLLSDLPIQYADFAHWQRQWLKGEVLETQLSYWEKKLAGSPPALNLPTDRPRPTIQTFCGSHQSLIVSSYLYESLKTLSRQEDATLFMTLFAAFLVLLHRYTGQDDIIVGTPIGGRSRIETEGLIGFFVNTLAVRTDLSGNLTFQELLANVREITLESYENQDLPFEKLVEELQPERDMSRTPLFQVMFNFENLPRLAQQIQGLRIHEMELVSRVAPFDLTLEIIEKEDGLSCVFSYNTDLFDSSTIERMAGHFETLLEGLVANPEQQISELPLLTAAERHQLLVEWNNTKRDYPRDKCIHQLFEEQVRLNQNKTAVISGDRSLSYSQLNDTANQLAHWLKLTCEINPDNVIGLLLGRSERMICAMLGVLKSGGAFLPIDPGYPIERIKYMLDDAAVKVLVSESKYMDLLRDYSGLVLLIDKRRELQTVAKENLTIANSSRDLAYVMYTSGSTGNPKGIAIEHSGLFNTQFWRKKFYGFDETYVTLQIASFSFDSSINDIFSMLMWGGTLVIADENERLEPKVLRNLIISQSITNFNVVPSFYSLLLEELDAKTKSLRVVTLTGEKLTKEIIKRHFERFSGVPIVNEYGPTENSICSTATLIKKITSRDAHIGKPIDNTRVYILGEQMELVPPGISGEICISGAGLARGYLNNAQLTAEKFVVNPYEPDERIYRTGDLGRWTVDGNIEFLGRIDHQVKIRGFRVELGEIETVIGQHPAVREAIVSAVENQPGIKRLVAYVVTEKDKSPNISELRRILKIKLPDHMVPSAFVFIDALPQTPSGKVDRKSLPLPSQERPELVNEFIMPRTPIEKTIAGIWSNILKIDRVGINDNFFELGGHSLLATQVISRLINTFRVQMPLRSLFQAPTVAELAVVIVQKQVEKAESKDIDRTLAKLEALSDEEARRLFNDEGVNGGNGN